MTKKRLYFFMIYCIFLLSTNSLYAQTCPDDLIALTNWYKTNPEFKGISEIRVQLTFKSISDITFSSTASETMQYWTVPNVNTPPAVFKSAPEGFMPADTNYIYDITFDLSSQHLENALAFRPNSITQGVMAPSNAILVSANISCVFVPLTPSLFILLD